MSATRTVPVGEHEAVVDADDYDLVSRFTWHALAGHNGKVYAMASVTRGTVYMHRLIAGTESGQETDHWNGDGLDNRRCNLRPASASQNRANMGKPRRPDGSVHTSRFKGVSWDRDRGRWQSKIRAFDPVSGRSWTRNLGRYDDEAQAARAYDAAAAAQWGDFARLNFPAAVTA